MKTVSLLSFLLLGLLGRLAEGRGGTGEFLRMGDAAEEDTKRNGGTALKFHAFLEVDFFEGMGNRPNDGEINQLEKKIKAWMTEVFSMDPTFESFEMRSVDTAYLDVNPDFFFITFTGVVNVGPAIPGLFNQMTMDEVAEMLDAADYDHFISHFIWKAAPEAQNEFYQTHTVTLKGWAMNTDTE